MAQARLLERLTPQDLLMLWPQDHGWPEDIAALAVIDGTGLLDDAGRVRLDAIRGRIESKLDLVPRFRQLLYRPRLGLGWPLWVDAPSFDVADHVGVRPVAAPGNEEQLLIACGELLQRRLDPARPLWEMWLLPGLTAGRVGLFVKLHHAVADGVAGIATLGALLDGSAHPPAVEVRPWTPVPAPSVGALFNDNVRRRLRQVRAGLAHLAAPRRTLHAVRRAPQWREFFGGRPAPKTSLNRPIGAGRKLMTVRGGLEPAREIAHANRATVNDVVLTAVAGGLRDLLQARGEDVQQLVLRALVPVSLHTHRQEQATGNRDAMMVVPLPLSESDAVRTLHLIAADTAVRKKQAHPPTATGLMSWPIIQRLTTRLLARQRFLNLSVTNISGPPTPLYLAGAQLLELFPIPPLVGNITLGVGVLSYAGQLNLTTVADSEACPDLGVFLQGVQDTLTHLAHSMNEQPDSAVIAKAGQQ
jgi:diacylglycerol O-acyltransferase / wax synthase